MPLTSRRLCLVLSTAFLLSIPASVAAQSSRDGTLRVTVKDPSGAVIPGARVRVTSAEAAADSAAPIEVRTDGNGLALAAPLRPGRFIVEIAFPGFETVRIPDQRVRAGDNRREVVLAIQKLDESVAVGRDPATNASDPANDRFASVLSPEQIAALPDDPEEMEKVLQEMAGPGGTIRVDGFRGGRLPPKSQIRSIRFASGMFAAENHGGGMMFVDIATQPGMGPLRGGVDMTFRDESLNARNAFQPQKAPERTQQYTFNLAGTLLKDRTSFSLSAGGASLYDSANIFAALADGTRDTSSVRRPSDRINFNLRVDHALSRSHSLRGSFQQSGSDQQNLGIGGFDLVDRGYGRTVSERVLRLSESGPLSRGWFGESRLQVRRADTEASAVVEAPTARVLDAFTIGGAQQDGGRRSTDIEWATNVDWARGPHAVRMGALVEGGSYRSDNRSNYLGTYTFASLADYHAGRPSTYTRRDGDPLVEYTHWQAGLFIQDDWRARKNLTLSAGLRQEFQTHMSDALNLAPRAGLTWSPFKNGRTTVRAGGGVFYDWLEAEVYEQTLRVDGVRQQELVVRNPGYPDPLSNGSSEVLPTSKYLLASSLLMPTRNMASAGVSHQITPTLGANLNVTYMSGSNRLRGRNINAPRDGVRPDPHLGNVSQVESTGRMRNTQVNAGVNYSLPGRRMFVFANYVFMDQKNDSDGPFGLPADSYNLAAEWGPAAGLPRHSASGILSLPAMAGIRLSLSATARSGPRYNVTTGQDDNGDTVFSDRPAGVGRNSAVGKGTWDAAARVSYAFGFGERAASGPGGPGGPTIVRIGGAGGAGDLLGGFGGGGAEDKRIRIELFASVQNLFNNVGLIGYSGVMTSPFFGEATAAMPGRRVDIGMRVGF
jgi:hypothetical protein